MEQKNLAADCSILDWAKVIENQKRSGLTIKAYCEREGIRENSYYYRKGLLYKTIGGRRANVQKKSVSDGSTSFAEVIVCDAVMKQDPRKIKETDEKPNTTPETEEETVIGEIRIEAAGFKVTLNRVRSMVQLIEIMKALVQL